MSSLIAVNVSGLKATATEAEVRNAFGIHGFVKRVELHPPAEEGGEMASATVYYESRTALEATGAALTAFGKEEPHACAAAGTGFLTVRLAPSQEAEVVEATAAAAQQPTGAQPPQQQPLATQPAMQPPPQPQHQPHPQPAPSYAPPPMHAGGAPPAYGAPSQYGAYGAPPAYGGYGGYGVPAPGGYDPNMYPPYMMQPNPAMPGAPMAGGSMPTTNHNGQPLSGGEVKLFVGGLPSSCSDVELRALMEPYGFVQEIHMMKPSEQTQQRCAFVTFEHHVSALAATKMGGVHRMTPYDRCAPPPTSQQAPRRGWIPPSLFRALTALLILLPALLLSPSPPLLCPRPQTPPRRRRGCLQPSCVLAQAHRRTLRRLAGQAAEDWLGRRDRLRSRVGQVPRRVERECAAHSALIREAACGPLRVFGARQGRQGRPGAARSPNLVPRHARIGWVYTGGGGSCTIRHESTVSARGGTAHSL